MKTNFPNRLLATLLVILSACQANDQGNEKLERQLDSVNQELEATKQALLDAQQVEALLDSIDASRQVTTTFAATDSDSQNNLNRLSDINDYVKDINLKMDQMEKSIKYVNTMANSILKLQADVEMRTQKIAKLEIEAKKVGANDRSMIKTIQRKDSTLAAFIVACQKDVSVLQKTMEEVHAKNNLATGDIYFKQAETLAAMSENVSNTSKRKLVRREALEMYKISLSLGRKEAQQKIAVLEKEI